MKIADKIRKLVAKAEGTDNQHEADVFMTKAHELMQEHGLSLLDLGKLDAEDPLGSSIIGHHYNANRWQFRVGSRLANYYGADIVGDPVGKNKFRWIVYGRESARVTFELMWPFVKKQVQQLAKRELAAGNYPSKSIAEARIGIALGTRLYHMTENNNQTKATAALVPFDEIAALINEEHSSLSHTGARIGGDKNAHNVAREVNIHRQAGGAQRRLT